MPITRFSMTPDTNGINAFGLPDSNTKFQTVLTASLEQTLTVPDTGDATYQRVMAVFSFQPGSYIWYSVNATATLPAGAFSSTRSEQNPQVRYLKSGDILHFITRSTTAEVGVMFYAVQ
jgi:hypothetical protein